MFQRISTTRIGRGWETVTRTAGRTQLALRQTAERARSEALALRKAMGFSLVKKSIEL